MVIFVPKFTMRLNAQIESTVQDFAAQHYGVHIEQVEIQPTRAGFDGDLTVVVFPLLKSIRSTPALLAKEIGDALCEAHPFINSYSTVQGFLNLVISNDYFLKAFQEFCAQPIHKTLINPENKGSVLVEYSSPNTNKPLHLGHIRNNLLGFSVSKILKAAGYEVYKTQIINDRGIHICKSMVAWKNFGNGETPQNTGLKGDALVGKYYVLFDQHYKQQVADLVAKGVSDVEAKKNAPILLEAQEMLRAWEANDPSVRDLWALMNKWVYEGFGVTYNSLGVDFDSYYYESETYLLGKEVVAQGLKKGIFYKKEDGSVWIDLTEEGLDEKVVLRSDGTSVYITQDLGTAIQRSQDYPKTTGMVYTVGNEQDYHFKVLFLILKKLGFGWANSLHHLSYGMVDLPSGKMKSREGTVVDADDLMYEMTQTAQNKAQELGKLEGMPEDDKNKLYSTIGLGALKYFILKVDPKKRIVFNPEESVDFNGNTGPFIQYTYARIQSLLRKATAAIPENIAPDILLDQEKQLLKILLQFQEIVWQAAQQYSPALVANYCYELVRAYNSYYQSVSILGDESLNNRQFRLKLSKQVGLVIASGCDLLGISVPDRM